MPESTDPRDQFDLDRFLTKLKLNAFNIAITIVTLVWLCRAVWHEIKF